MVMSFNNFDPWKGQRIGSAWLAGLHHLRTGHWMSVTILRQVMMIAGSVQSQTVSTILREAVRADAIEMKGSYSHTAHRDYRQARLIAPQNHHWLVVPADFVPLNSMAEQAGSGGPAGAEANGPA